MKQSPTRSLTKSRRRLLVSITLPLLLPDIVSALRSAYGVAWTIALVAELFGARSGLGFDDAIDYRAAGNLTAAVGAECPGGVDIYFDNVGGPMLVPCCRL